MALQLLNLGPTSMVMVEADKTELLGLINAKAESSVVEALSGRVTTAEGEIDALQAAIATKAETSVVTAIDGRLTTAEGEIDFLQAAVATKADATALESLATKQEVTDGLDGKINWDVITNGTPIEFDKANNKVTFAVDESYVTLTAEGAVTLTDGVKAALDHITPDATYITTDMLENSEYSPFYINGMGNVQIITDGSSGIHTTYTTTIDPLSGVEVQAFGLALNTELLADNLTQYGLIAETALQGQTYSFSTLEGVFDAVKTIVEKLGATVTDWPVEATA